MIDWREKLKKFRQNPTLISGQSIRTRQKAKLEAIAELRLFDFALKVEDAE